MWDPGLVWTGAETLVPTGIRSPDLPVRSESLYRLSYPGPGIAPIMRNKSCKRKYLFGGKNKDGNHEPENNDRINKGRAAISKLNSILWDRYVTPKTKTHVYHAVVKNTITYAVETWCLKAKTVAKLNFTEMDF